MNLRKLLLPVVAGILLALGLGQIVGCKNANSYIVAEGSDPVIVRAEQTLAISFATVNAFINWEHANRRVAGPQVTKAADAIRKAAPDVFRLANSLLQKYKAAKSEENKSQLNNAISAVTDLSRKAQQFTR